MIVAVLGLVRASAATPSFDCDGAKTEVERLICTDDELAALDVKLAKMFASALAKAPADAVTALKASQKAWRKQLLKCGKDGNPHQCIHNAYSSRLSGS